MRRPSPALILSCLAVFFAATGGAVAGVQISGKQIKNNSITGKDIKNDSLNGSDIKGDIRGPEGPRGPRGPAGAAGGTGPGGSGGGLPISYRSNTEELPAGASRFVYALCPAGQVPVGGSYRAQQGLAVSYDRFGDSTSANPDSWVAVLDNPTTDPLSIEVQVACIPASSVSPF